MNSRRASHRQRPLAHLGVGAGGQVDAADGRVLRQGLAGPQHVQPLAVLLERAEEALDPLLLAEAEVPGAGPGAELLAVVAHHAHQRAVLGGVLAQVVDDLFDRPEGDAVAQALLGAVDDDAVALVVGGVGTPVQLLRGWPRPGSGRRRRWCSRSRPSPAPWARPAPRRARPARRRRDAARPATRPRRPSASAGPRGRPRAATPAPARSSRRRAPRPGHVRPAHAGARWPRACSALNQSSSGPV